jgi:3D (Asp-Asp-Asp) domain-containing protein
MRLSRRSLIGLLALAACGPSREPVRLPAIVVESPLRLDPVVVRGAGLNWARNRLIPARYGDPVPVRVTEYCLTGTTRRGRYVRAGIVAADPHLFPLSRFIELYVGTRYLGRYLVDDTGKRILGARIDLWTSSCREARRFGIQHGTAVLVARPPISVRLAGHPKAK